MYTQQLQALSKKARRAIEKRLREQPEVIFCKSDLHEQTEIDPDSLPDFNHASLIGDYAKIISLKRINRASIEIVGVDCETGKKISTLLHELSDSEVIYLADYLEGVSKQSAFDKATEFPVEDFEL